MSPCQPPSLLGLKGQGHGGSRAAQREGLFPAGLHLQGLLLQPPPLSTPPYACASD